MDNVLSKANGLLVGIIDIGIKLIAAGVILQILFWCRSSVLVNRCDRKRYQIRGCPWLSRFGWFGGIGSDLLVLQQEVNSDSAN